MNIQSDSSISCLENARHTLRDVLDEEFRNEANAEAASLDRMLVHLENMDAALETSPESKTNIIKRLGDFSLTASRMAIRNLSAAPKLSQLADVLRAASQQMREWNAPGQPTG